MTDRHATEQTSRARPMAPGTEPDLVVVVEYQRIELKRVLKENQNLRGDIDRLLRLLERDQVIRQQEQQDRGTMIAVMNRLAVERALPPPPPPNTAAPEAVVAGEAASDAPPPDLGEDAPGADVAENEFETSLSDLQEICDRLESVRAQAPGEAANQTAEPAQSVAFVQPAAPAQPAALVQPTAPAQPAEPASSAAPARPAAPAESPDDMAALSENADLAALLRRLDQLVGTEEEIGPRSTTGFMADAEGPGSAEARAKRVLARLAALFERRP